MSAGTTRPIRKRATTIIRALLKANVTLTDTNELRLANLILDALDADGIRLLTAEGHRQRLQELAVTRAQLAAAEDRIDDAHRWARDCCEEERRLRRRLNALIAWAGTYVGDAPPSVARKLHELNHDLDELDIEVLTNRGLVALDTDLGRIITDTILAGTELDRHQAAELAGTIITEARTPRP